MRPNYRQKGFTLIELLVVISIIGVLSGIVLLSLQDARKQARDARRLVDAAQIKKAILLYYDKNGVLPPISADACCDGWDQGPCAAEASPNIFITSLITANIMGTVPVDPSGKPAGYADADCYGYDYYVYPAGSYGCDATRGNFYVLGIRNMETSGNPHRQSEGFSCSGRDWQSEFEWVTGGYEKDF